MKESDCLRRFVFAGRDVRGEWVRLEQSWQEILSHAVYPAVVREQLGQAMAAATLLSATVKFQGSLILQAQGDGPLRTLVAQATHERGIRGLARHQPEVPGGDLAAVYGQGHLVLTIQAKNAEPYQGVVELTGKHLADALETYFNRSEQLRTRLWLYADATQAVGLLLQELPNQHSHENDWEHLQTLAGTVTEEELRGLSCEDLLYRLFHQENVHLFDLEAVAFSCTCSKEKIENTLLGMGRQALEEILHSHDNITVGCEFCNRQYRYDKAEVERMLNAAEAENPATILH